ncbi:hypothetical protein EIQ10_08305 [Xanthomonas campestris pv. campestris]
MAKLYFYYWRKRVFRGVSKWLFLSLFSGRLRKLVSGCIRTRYRRHDTGCLCPTSDKHRYHQPRTLNQAATQGGGTSIGPIGFLSSFDARPGAWGISRRMGCPPMRTSPMGP